MKKEKHCLVNFAEGFKNVWVILAAVCGIVYWAARQDSSLTDIKENRTKIAMLETRMAILETGLGRLQVAIDGIKDDLSLIKTAVLK